MKCKYCGKEFAAKVKEVCPICTAKIPLAKLFVEECKQFKKIIGYESEGNDKNEG